MKRVLALILAISIILLVSPLHVSAIDSSYDVKLVVSKNDTNDEVYVSFEVQSDSLLLKNVQSVVFEYDAEVITPSIEEVELLDGWDVMPISNTVKDSFGYIVLQPYNFLLSTNCGAAKTLATMKFNFNEGKGIADLTNSSIKYATLEQATNVGASATILITNGTSNQYYLPSDSIANPTLLNNAPSVEWDFEVGTSYIAGTPVVCGDFVYDEIIAADVTSLNVSDLSLFSYKWYRDGIEIVGANESTYKLISDDVGKVINVEITAEGYSGSVFSTNTSCVSKAIPEIPEEPSVETNETTAIIDSYNENYLYACVEADAEITDADFKDFKDGIIDGLTINTMYDLYCKSKENANYFMSGISEKGTFVTKNHKFGGYTYDEFHHWKECVNDGCEEIDSYGEHIFEKHVLDAFQAKEATCTSPAIYYYSCSCGKCSTDTFENGNALGHNFTKKIASNAYMKSDATADDLAIYYYACSRCDESAKGIDETKTYTNGDKLKFSVSVTKGSADPSANIYKGTTVTITANTPDKGYQFKEWNVKAGTITLTSKTSATTTFTMPGENVTVEAAYEFAPIAGTVTITGDAVYGKTLTASVGGDNNTGTLTYTWYAGDKELGTGTTYVVGADAVGKAITCKVTSSNQTGTIVSTATSVVSKATNTNTVTGLGSTPTTKIGATDGTITGVTTAMEYKLSTASSWTKCSGTTITGLDDGKYLVRYAETATHGASASTEVTVAEHTHTFDKQVIDAKYLKSAANCTNNAVYYKSCDCGDSSKDTENESTFEAANTALGHAFTKKIITGDYLKSAATADSSAIYYYACSRCDESAKGIDETKTYTNGDKLKFSVSVTKGLADPSANIYKGTTVTIIANTPDKGYKFKEWDVKAGTITLASKTSATTTFTMPGENVTVEAVYEFAPIAGTVTIIGDAVYDKTLTASVSGDNNTGTLTYTWYAGDTKLGEGTTYKIGADAVGKAVTCKVTSDNQTDSISASTSVVAKADNTNTVTGLGSTPTTKIGATDGTITGVTTAMEYKLSTASSWTKCSGTTITGLDDGKYLVRYAETATYAASASTEITVAEHTHTFDKQVVDAKYLKSAATADSSAVYYKSCVCGESSKDITNVTFENGDKLKFSVSVTKGLADPSVNIYKGTTVTITANTPDKGYKFKEWDVKAGTITLASKTSATTTFTMPGENVTVEAVYEFATLNGTVSVTGTPKPSNVLTATLTDSNNTGDITFEWYVDGSEIATGNTYTIAGTDVDKVVVCKAISSKQTGSVAASEITILSNAAPDAPTGLSSTAASSATATDGTITGVTTAMEYSADGKTWTTCPNGTITGLAAGTYSVRYKAVPSSGTPAGVPASVEVKSHAHAYDKQVTDAKYLKSAATCTSPAVYFYSCACGEKGTTTFTSGSALGHSYGKWSKLDDNQHQRVCATDGSHIEKANHNWDKGVVTTAATCTADGVKTFTCSDCAATKTETIAKLGHNYVNGKCSRCGDIQAGTTGANNRLFSSGYSTIRYSGNSRYETSFATANALKSALGVSKFKTIIVADGNNFADALAGSYLAAKKSAPILMVNAKNGANDTSGAITYIANNLEKGGTIYILGGTNSVSAAAASSYAKYGTVKRIAGDNRYATNLAILKEAGGVSGQDLLICDGSNFADALSCSALGKPLLLVDKYNIGLSAEQKSYVNSAKNIYIIGGTGSVPEQYKNLVGKAVTRVAGADRFETSLAIANKFSSSFAGKSAVIATGANFPDGLSGGPLAYALGAPLILTNNDSWNYNKAKSYVGSKKVVTLGGVNSLADSTVKTVRSGNIESKTY